MSPRLRLTEPGCDAISGGVGQLVSQARSIESKCSLLTGLAM
jgi:hypothetical protein